MTLDDPPQESTPLKFSDTILDTSLNSDVKPSKSTLKFRLLQILQGVLLFATYASTYLAISALSLAVPLMTASREITLPQVSMIIISTKVFRFVPKLFSGAIVDYLGGKMIYIISHFLIAFALVL
jgi:sugar phosphate permease